MSRHHTGHRAGPTMHAVNVGVSKLTALGGTRADPEMGARPHETLRDRPLFVMRPPGASLSHISVAVDSRLPEHSVPSTPLYSHRQELLGQDGFNSTSYLQVLFDSHKGCSVAIKAIFN